MLRLYRNHSALLDSLHAPTQPYTTTYQPYSTHWDQLVVVAGSELTSDSGSTYGLDTVFSTPSSSGLFRCCLFAGFIMSMVCLLAGIVSTRPSAFVEGEGFEPPVCALRSIIYYNVRRQIITRCLRPLGQPSLFRLLRENQILASFILARCLFHPFHVHLQFHTISAIHTVQCPHASLASLRHPTTALQTRCSISPLANRR